MSAYPSIGAESRQVRDGRPIVQPVSATEPQRMSSAVSWAAIFAGATAAAALSLVLLILGTGLGLSAVSPWAPKGISAEGFGISAITWITLTQVAASGMGGYLAGRLRTKWVSVHSDEVYFRDTAHGFLAWAIASLATAALLSSVTGAIVGNSVQVGATVAGTASVGAATMAAAARTSPGVDAAGPSATGLSGYFVDALFRKDTTSASAGPATAAPLADADASTAASVAETGRIFVNGIRAGALPPEDIRYAGQLVAQRTGLAQADAEKRVADSFARMQTKFRETETAARDAADKARKASAYAALWVFISLLTGAFVASLAATFGGRQRDQQMHVQPN